ncbi:hypothetical protein RM704_28405 [Streptomyces sp. DSM 3412]|uniref:Uncharacterized protein n=1 Tax=Streptomyces gottesmaniae TaxID=3075518 RepID=A0ABU2Z7G0_9ACTN|nr:hypothetical protein [Streptomyces sp. DSM 3412]MDT0571337.1 hypothetical protein [Streptomyces sp. DSM 3412]
MADVGGGPVFHGPVSGSQIAWGNRDVVQNQRLDSAPALDDLQVSVQTLLDRLDDLGLSPADTVSVRTDADALLDEASADAPDPGRLHRLHERIRAVLGVLATGAVTGAGAGAAQLAQSMLADVQRALP